MKDTSGYSGTPLAKKLGIKEGFSILTYNAPEHYWGLFSDLPNNLDIHKRLGEDKLDFIHIFCTTLEELKMIASQYKEALKVNGSLWVSWPKGTSKIKTDLKREPVREHLLSIGLVDTKVAAIDEDWSGLKFVYRLKDRR
ncbi:DUF3052 domain-containing protein [Muricauda sp. CAU 1633]|uniref:DUF3052 domain-containing protein n=1 Tax=Allomuricauda sp. CAU 1633 TaxID=2816036 RepID=UPI001A8CAEB7|nr:DUF3052 domain-containing protein [Muricauda sp. CAU 1633]MBO0323214.1 DUF3052 domain-containing protein [Muricauda sp. CAU 1633]